MIDMGYIKQITFYEVKMLFRNNVFIILDFQRFDTTI